MTDTEAVGSPTVRRRRLGLLLKGYREAAGQTAEQAAGQIGVHLRTLRRWERGQVGIADADLGRLLTQYAVPPPERAQLYTLSAEGKLSGWWVSYADVVRPSYARWIGLEAEATGLDEWSAMLVPGLLQTDAYAEAVIRYGEPRMPEAAVARRMEVRRRRQEEAASRDYPVRYVLDEAVLRRVVGDAQTMAEQADHLIAVAREGRSLVRVLPFNSPPEQFHPISGGFAILRFDDMTPVALAEFSAGDVYADGEEAARYAQQFEALQRGALDFGSSLEMIADVRGSYAR